MKTYLRLILSVLLVGSTTVVYAQDTDDMGVWVELEAEKTLPYNLEVGLSGEMRTEDNTSRIDRFNIGPSLGYKINKYFKVGVGYQFLFGYTPSKQSKREYSIDDELIAYRYTPSYWTPRHRINIEGTGSYKLWKCVRLSVRERYQYTYQPEKTITGRYDTEAPLWEHDPAKNKVNPSENRHVLRSRFKAAYDRKHCDWSPFVSLEFHNSLTDRMHFDKLRTSLGTSYKINQHNDVSLCYIMTLDRTDVVNERMHAICAGYSFDF